MDEGRWLVQNHDLSQQGALIVSVRQLYQPCSFQVVLLEKKPPMIGVVMLKPDPQQPVGFLSRYLNLLWDVRLRCLGTNSGNAGMALSKKTTIGWCNCWVPRVPCQTMKRLASEFNSWRFCQR